MFGLIQAAVGSKASARLVGLLVMAEGFALAAIAAAFLFWLCRHSPQWADRNSVILVVSDMILVGGLLSLGLALKKLYPIPETPYAIPALSWSVMFFWISALGRIAEAYSILAGGVGLLVFLRLAMAIAGMAVAYWSCASFVAAIRWRSKHAARARRVGAAADIRAGDSGNLGEILGREGDR